MMQGVSSCTKCLPSFSSVLCLPFLPCCLTFTFLPSIISPSSLIILPLPLVSSSPPPQFSRLPVSLPPVSSLFLKRGSKRPQAPCSHTKTYSQKHSRNNLECKKEINKIKKTGCILFLSTLLLYIILQCFSTEYIKQLSDLRHRKMAKALENSSDF